MKEHIVLAAFKAIFPYGKHYYSKTFNNKITIVCDYDDISITNIHFIIGKDGSRPILVGYEGRDAEIQKKGLLAKISELNTHEYNKQLDKLLYNIIVEAKDKVFYWKLCYRYGIYIEGMNITNKLRWLTLDNHTLFTNKAYSKLMIDLQDDFDSYTSKAEHERNKYTIARQIETDELNII